MSQKPPQHPETQRTPVTAPQPATTIALALRPGMSAYAKRQLAREAAVVIGVDAGKFEHALVVRPQRGSQAGRDSRPITCRTTRAGFDGAVEAIQAILGAIGATPEETLVGIEFAGTYGFTLAHYLHERGFRVVSVLAAHTKHWKEVTHNQALKTDAKDALVICDLVAQGKFVQFPFLARPFAELRYLVSAREHVSVLRTGALTRLMALLDVVFPEYERLFVQLHKPTALAVLRAYPGPAALLAAPKRRVLAVLKASSRNHLGRERYAALLEAARSSLALPAAQGVLKDEVPLVIDRLALYEAQLRELKTRMIAVLDQLPEAQALLTIPGVAPVTAATFLGCVGDPRAYASSAQVLKLAGLSLVERSSGITKGRQRVSKRGRPVLRRQAFMLALRTVRSDKRCEAGIFRKDFERLLANNGGRKVPALVALSRKALRLLYTVAREQRPYVPETDWRGGLGRIPEATSAAAMRQGTEVTRVKRARGHRATRAA